MNPDDIIKAASTINTGLTTIGAAIPFTAIINKMLGPASEELAERFRDRVRIYRYGRQLDCLKKAEKMAEDAGFTPKAVPIKLLFPLLEGASLEENEDLHTMWAALMANAADPDGSEKVRPGFIATLKQISSDEAKLLERIYDDSRRIENRTGRYQLNFQSLSIGELYEAYQGNPIRKLNGEERTRLDALGFQHASFMSARDGLYSARLLETPINHARECSRITHRGITFVEACRPPKIRSKE